MEGLSRRNFLQGVGTMAAACVAVSRMAWPPSSFAIQDFGHQRRDLARTSITPATSRLTNSGMSWIELRSMWGKNAMDLSDAQIAEAQKHPRQIQSASHRHRQPAVQDRLAGRAQSPYGSKDDLHGAAEAHSSSRTRFWRSPLPSPSNSRPTRSAASTSGGLTTSLPTAPPSTTSCAQRPRYPANRASCWSSKTSLNATPPPAAKPRGR